MQTNLATVLEGLTYRQRALYWLVRAEASSLDEQMMLTSVCAKQIRATALDALTVREALLSGQVSEAGEKR